MRGHRQSHLTCRCSFAGECSRHPATPMALSSGSRLGPYEILGTLGAGGMGEVYKARDGRLDRLVAIKVLPDRLAADVDLRQRFEREARAVAALQHAHICTLHDVGHQNGTDYLVMEYLEGQTLAERLQRGALPIGTRSRSPTRSTRPIAPGSSIVI
ncbi:MAG: hypothetical protein DMF86_21675 [Acidobacteria bacterium]|nr:MAG: hypothetical protein DMF86_21675 [Acidobacteriota bacterium]